MFALVLISLASTVAEVEAQYRISVADLPAREDVRARPARAEAAPPTLTTPPTTRQVRPAVARQAASVPRGPQEKSTPATPTLARRAAPAVAEDSGQLSPVADAPDDAIGIDWDEAQTLDCETCRAPGAFCLTNGWIQGEYLMWWPRAMRIQPLVTSGTPVSEGALGRPGTQTLVGGPLLDDAFSGARLRLGLWTDACHERAWMAEAFVIGERTFEQSFSGSGGAGTSVLAVPFFVPVHGL